MTGHLTEEALYALDMAIEEAVETDQFRRVLGRGTWREETDEASDHWAREDKVYDEQRGGAHGGF